MKRVLLFILPILVIITAGLVVLGIVQVRSVRERMQACIICDRERNFVAVTERIAGLKEPDREYLKLAIETKAGRGELKRAGEYQLDRHIEPVRNKFLLTHHLRDYMLLFLSLYHADDIVYL
jgi:hypothetical protein